MIQAGWPKRSLLEQTESISTYSKMLSLMLCLIGGRFVLPQVSPGLATLTGVERSQVTLVVEDGVIVGNVRVEDSYFQVRYVGADLHVIQQIDESRFPPDGGPIPVYVPAQGAIQGLGIAAADNGSTFDVMVVYTPAARAAAGGTTAMNALINLAVAETNTAYSRSGVIPRLRLVHREEVAYTESGNFSTDLNRLTKSVRRIHG